jgi:hypothetical protein
MTDFENFEQLDDKDFFVRLVTDHYEHAWEEVNSQVGVTPIVSRERVEYAFETYHNNIAEIRVRLASQNPDHYKRAASLLDALNRAQVVTELEFNLDVLESLEQNTAVGLSHGDCQYRLKYVNFLETSCNQAMAFDLSFRCCQAYEPEENAKHYSPNYLENMCHYLCHHDDKNVGSLYLMLYSYFI